MKNQTTDFTTNLNSSKSTEHVITSSAASKAPLNPVDSRIVNQAAELLKTLAHPLRIRVVLLLAKKRSMNVSTLQRQLNVDQAILSYQLIKMKDRGLLTSIRQGKEIHYSLTDLVPSELMLLLLSRETA